MGVQDYTAQSHMYLALALLITVIAVAVLAVFLIRRLHLASAEMQRRQRAIQHLAQDQDTALSGTIMEITGNPATYSDFPPQLLAEIMRLHTAYPRVIRGETEREIY